MEKKKLMNRSYVVVGAVLIQLALGAIYAWSVFTPSLVADGWSKQDTQWIFAVGLVLRSVTPITPVGPTTRAGSASPT